MLNRYLAILPSRSIHGRRVGVAAILFTAIISVVPRANCFGQTFWTDGTGSWFAPGNWSLGVPDAGSATAFDAVIENGGTAQLLAPGGSVRRLRVGRSAGTGNLLVDAGTLAVTESFYLNEGVAGVSSATIQNGGTVTSPSTVIAQTGSGTSNFTVTGNNSSLTTDSLTVGNGGTGILNIQNNGLVYVTNAVSINSVSAVNLTGGTLRFNTISAPNRVVYTSGTIQLAGSRDFSTDTTISTLFPSSTIPAGKRLVVEGTGTIQIATELVDGGEFDCLGGLNVGSTFAGYLKVLNGGKVVVSGNSTIDSGVHSINQVSGAGSTWTIGGNLSIGTGDLTITSQGVVYVGGAVSFSTAVASDEIVLNGGTLRFSSYSNTSRLTYTAGTIQIAGDHILGADATISAIYGSQNTIPTGKQLTVEGTATVAASSQLTLSGGTFSAGSVLVSPGGRVVSTQPSQLKGPTLALAGSSIDATAGDLTVGDATKVNGFYSNGTTIAGSHAMTLADANDAVFDSAALVSLGAAASPGTINAANGLTLDFGGNITGFGAISTPNSIAKPLINNGHITGTSIAQPITLSGYVKGVGTFDNVNFTGTFSPGLSPTILTVGNIAMSSTNTLVMELGGTTPGGGYDQIQASDLLALGGTLQVSLINGFHPSLANQFTVLSFGSRSGDFASYTGLSLGGHLSLKHSFTAGSLLLKARPTQDGDINLDGIVDISDVQSVAANWLTTHVNGDANDDGFVDISDIQFIAANWLHTDPNPGSGSGTAVPEPSTIVLAAICGFALLAGHRRCP